MSADRTGKKFRGSISEGLLTSVENDEDHTKNTCDRQNSKMTPRVLAPWHTHPV